MGRKWVVDPKTGRGRYVSSQEQRIGRKRMTTKKEPIETQIVEAGKPKPAPAPTPAPAAKPPTLISPTKKIAAAITGKIDGKELTALERVQQVTGAVRNIVLGTTALAAVGTGISAITAGKTSAAAAVKAYSARQGIIYATSSKAATLGIKGATGAAKGIAFNVKTQQLAGSIATKVFTTKKLAVAGLSAIVGMETASLVLGLWAGAEAPEPVLFMGDDIMTKMQWSLINNNPEQYGIDKELWEKWKLAILEYTDKSTIDRIIDFSPLGFVRNILRKGDEIGKGAKLRIELGDNIIESYETGRDLKEIETEKKTEKQELSAEEFRLERIKTEEAILKVQKEAREARDIVERKILEEEMALWKKHKKDIIELEKKEREATAKFWLEYAKLKMQMRLDSSPSNLNFGLL